MDLNELNERLRDTVAPLSGATGEEIDILKAVESIASIRADFLELLLLGKYRFEDMQRFGLALGVADDLLRDFLSIERLRLAATR